MTPFTEMKAILRDRGGAFRYHAAQMGISDTYLYQVLNGHTDPGYEAASKIRKYITGEDTPFFDRGGVPRPAFGYDSIKAAANALGCTTKTVRGRLRRGEPMEGAPKPVDPDKPWRVYDKAGRLVYIFPTARFAAAILGGVVWTLPAYERHTLLPLPQKAADYTTAKVRYRRLKGCV